MQDAAAKVESSFTDEKIKTLFSNIEEITAMHEDLMEVLDKTCATSLSYETPIAGCYLVIVSQPAAQHAHAYIKSDKTRTHTSHICKHNVNMVTAHIHSLVHRTRTHTSAHATHNVDTHLRTDTARSFLF